jgi:hypothetical protein
MTHNLSTEELDQIKDLIYILTNASDNRDSETFDFGTPRNQHEAVRLAWKVNDFIR